jgi:hypothetical protein
MKRLGLMVALLALGVSYATAEMDNRSFGALQTVGASTNSRNYVLRGELYGVYVNVGTATTRTQTVTVASAEQTLFTKDVSADGWYPLQYPQYGATGSALTFNTYSATGMVARAQAWNERAPLAGTVTVTVVGKNGANKTNTTEAVVIYKK